MANISFALTTPQLLAEQKFVTRRLGWKRIKIGVVHNAVDQIMGFKKGEHPNTLTQIVPIYAMGEKLSRITTFLDYGEKEVFLEGFKDMSPNDFVEFFCDHNKCETTREINRIAFGMWRDGKVYIPLDYRPLLKFEIEDFESKFPGMMACD